MNYKVIGLILFILLFINNFSFTKEEVPSPKAKFRQNDLTVNNWSPPTSLSTHFGKGSWDKNTPIFDFNLNLGYLRFFMKSDMEEDQTYIFNEWFSYIVELKPFDFVSFITSGSSYSLFVERNEWLRNFTFILTNKTFSSTQFITAPMQWYFDLLYNGVPVANIIEPQGFTAKSALARLYPSTREEAIGISNRLHIFQTSSFAVGLTAYFEFHIPDRKNILKDHSAFNTPPRYSSKFTYGLLVGSFFRYKKNLGKTIEDFEVNASILYHRLEGEFDQWVITVDQNTLSVPVEVGFNEQYFAHVNFYYITWTSQYYDEQFDSYTINVGGEIKGFGDKLHWFGPGFDFAYQYMKQDFAAKGGKFQSLNYIFSLNFYPLAFHVKDHKLKVSVIYGLIDYEWEKFRRSGAEYESDTGLNFSLMMRINYSFN